VNGRALGEPDAGVAVVSGEAAGAVAPEFKFAFSAQVIARLMGLPRENYVRFQQLSIELLSVVYDWDIGMAASATSRRERHER
jgi:hypothetical protein